MADEIREFLTKNNLSQYINKFIELGYDDLTQLLDMSSDEIIGVMKEVALLYDKPGHRKRFVSAIQILSSKSKHGVPSDEHRPSSASRNVETWPAPAKDLWIPNPLTPQMEFYNKVLCVLYEAVFDLNIPPLQFKNYVIEQRVTRWKIQKTIDMFKNNVKNIFNEESKDGNAKNVQKFASKMTSFKTGDQAKALASQEILEKLLAKVIDISSTVVEKRSSLFNKANEVKPWKANELKFYDDNLEELKSMKKKLEESHTMVITNRSFILGRKIASRSDSEKDAKRKRKRVQENSRKVVVRKERRLFARACELTKIITGGKVDYKCLERGKEKICAEDLCAEPKLKPRFHLTALKTLIENDYFEENASELASEMMIRLTKEKELSTSQRKSNSRGGKKQCTIDLFMQKPLATTSSPQPSSSSASSVSSESGAEND